jgi:hypothetical protein
MGWVAWAASRLDGALAEAPGFAGRVAIDVAAAAGLLPAEVGVFAHEIRAFER